jgi:hypothetical protein
MSMLETSTWIARLRRGDERAAQQLFENYYRLLVHRAREKLGDWPRRPGDESDVANSALKSFFLGIQRGQFLQINDR